MRFSLRKLGLLSAVFLTLLVSIYALNVYMSGYTPQTLRKLDLITKQNIHHKSYKFSGLDQLIQTHPDFHALPLNQRCKVFFKEYETLNPGWSFPQHGGGYSKDIDKFEIYVKNYVKKRVSDQTAKQVDELIKNLSIDERSKIQNEFEKKVTGTLEMDQSMADTISLMRVYGKCFVGNDKRDEKLFEKITKKLFRYLTFGVPIFETLEGETPIKFNNGLPEFIDGSFTKSVKEPKTQNLIQFYQEAMNGKGIVISASSKHAKEVSRLIRVLRVLGNTLPIQIVHRSNFNNKGKDLVTIAARETLQEALEGGKVDEAYLDSKPSTYPQQKVLFSNIKTIVTGKLFAGYNNKLLALAFSSFKEVVLIDADTVPLVELERLFESKEYTNTSTMFFKDRSLRDTNDYLETNFFQRLFPMNEESLDTLFDIPLLPKAHLMQNNYIRGYRHFQEAGVVVIDKGKHFLGILMLLPLGMWKEPIKTAVWGDKELYWIAMLMAGDYNFKFNEYEAASIGVETPKNLQIYDFESHEVCSTHPGHLNENGELLWINSGFSYCKKNGHYRDREKYPFSKIDIESLHSIYDNPLKITHAVVPPSLPDLRDLSDESNLEKENSIMQKWKQNKKDSDEIKEFGKDGIFTKKIKYAPQKGWVKNGICSGYYYCGYDVVEKDGHYEKGEFFTFNDTSVAKFDLLGKVWSLAPPKPVEGVFSNFDRRKKVEQGVEESIESTKTSIDAVETSL